jgi:replicative DNA helicase
MDSFVRDINATGVEAWQAAKLKADTAAGITTVSASHWIADIDYEWDNPEMTRGYPVGLEPLDKLLSGWRAGEITVLSGRSGIGKSTLACFLSLVQAVDTAMLYLTFEVLPKNIVRKWISMLANKAFHKLSREEYVASRKRLARRSIWIADNYGMVQLEDVRKSVYDACNRHSVRFVVIDHLGHLVSMGKEDATKESGKIIRECKRWALDLGVHILLVAHLRKPGVGDGSKARMEDLRGSSEIYQTSDNVALLERRDGQTDCIVRIVKCRDDAGYEGKAELSFDPLSLRYMPR